MVSHVATICAFGPILVDLLELFFGPSNHCHELCNENLWEKLQRKFWEKFQDILLENCWENCKRKKEGKIAG